MAQPLGTRIATPPGTRRATATTPVVEPCRPCQKRSPMPLWPLVMAAVANCLVALPPSTSRAAGAPGYSPAPLRGDPDRLCLPTAAVGQRDGVAWVADGRIDDRLFGFSLAGGKLTAAKARNVDLSSIPAAERPRDVEAATTVVRSLVLVGSHARSAGCEIQPDRERILVAAVDANGKAATERAIDDAPVMASLRRGDEQACLDTLFNTVGRTIEASRLLCRALLAAERAASQERCETLAIAGSTIVPLEGRERLWLALRSPLVDGKAVLVRLASLTAFRFDMTALVDLGGSGIRELGTYRRTAFAIAGSSADPRAPFALYALTPRGDETFDVRRLRDDLLPASEALLATDDGMVVLADGEGDGGSCRVPARQYLVKDAAAAP